MNYSFEDTGLGPSSPAKDMYDMLGSKKLDPWKFNAGKNATEIKMKVKYEFDGVQKVSGTNMLGLVVFSIVFGYILGQLGETGEPMVVFFRILLEVTMRMISMAIW